MDGEKYLESKNARSTRVNFTKHRDPSLIVDKKGTRRLSSPNQWRQVAVYVVKYLTCEGRKSCLHSLHFKLLSHIRHNRRMNVPNVLYNLLSIIAAKTQKGRPNFVLHHCLIKLLVDRSLRDVSQMSWDEFVSIRKFREVNDRCRGHPSAQKVSITKKIVKLIARASTSRATSTTDSPAAELRLTKSSSSDTNRSSVESNVNVQLKTPIRTRIVVQK